MTCTELYKNIYHKDPDHLSFCPYRISPFGAHIDHQLGRINGLAIDKGMDDVIARFRQTFDKRKNLRSWQELNHLYVRHGMMDQADAMYKELLAERKELIAEGPEYAYRAYIDYITLYHRDMKDALQCYLDAKEVFQDTDIEGFWELELMVYTNTFNDPERFEIERKPFMEKGLLTEEAVSQNSLYCLYG